MGYCIEAKKTADFSIFAAAQIRKIYRSYHTFGKRMAGKRLNLCRIRIRGCCPLWTHFLDINMKVWEGETNASMKKGLGHYSSTSAWDGNVGVCGHNRGAKYTIGSIKNLKKGDTITYNTVNGTRTYAVETVTTISNDD